MVYPITKDWAVVANPGTDNEEVIKECWERYEALRFITHCGGSEGPLDVMKYVDGVLTTEY